MDIPSGGTPDKDDDEHQLQPLTDEENNHYFLRKKHSLQMRYFYCGEKDVDIAMMDKL